MELFGKFHGIDVLCLALFVRILYIATQRGLLTETIKLSGVLFATFLSLHNYTAFLSAIFTREPFSFDREPLDVVSFFIIFSVSLLAFFFIRRSLVTIFSREIFSWKQKIASCILGFLRAALLISIFVFIGYQYSPLYQQVEDSFAFKMFARFAPATYRGVFFVYEKINPLAAINNEVVRYQEGLR